MKPPHETTSCHGSECCFYIFASFVQRHLGSRGVLHGGAMGVLGSNPRPPPPSPMGGRNHAHPLIVGKFSLQSGDLSLHKGFFIRQGILSS
jgi:hypothetical protein